MKTWRKVMDEAREMYKNNFPFDEVLKMAQESYTMEVVPEYMGILEYLCMILVWSGYDLQKVFYYLTKQEGYGKRAVLYEMGLATLNVLASKHRFVERKEKYGPFSQHDKFRAFLDELDAKDRAREQNHYDANCRYCNGTGVYPDSQGQDNEAVVCLECHGTGKMKAKITDPVLLTPFAGKVQTKRYATVRMATTKYSRKNTPVITYKEFLKTNTLAHFETEED